MALTTFLAEQERSIAELTRKAHLGDQAAAEAANRAAEAAAQVSALEEALQQKLEFVEKLRQASNAAAVEAAVAAESYEATIAGLCSDLSGAQSHREEDRQQISQLELELADAHADRYQSLGSREIYIPWSQKFCEGYRGLLLVHDIIVVSKLDTVPLARKFAASLLPKHRKWSIAGAFVFNVQISSKHLLGL